MPRIYDNNLDGVAFMYRTRDEAERRVKLGGSAFLVGRELAGSARAFERSQSLPYLVSNRHVVGQGGACIASVNRLDGGKPDIWEFDPHDWHPHPSGDDLAVACAQPFLRNNIHQMSFMRESNFVTDDVVREFDLGVGEEVYMVGRFLNLQGSGRNRPAARFGSISMMLEDIGVPRTSWGSIVQRGYAVEMRSRTGFSGAPVCVYRTLATVLTDVPKGKSEFFGLLGVNFGYILDEDGENTWLNGVIPASKITETLDVPELKKIHKSHEDHIKTFLDKNGGAGTALSAAFIPDEDAKRPTNPRHREDFNRLLGAAVKPPKSSGRT